jgi:hypothetical protein
MDITYGECSGEKRDKARQSLEKYCGLDTEGMAWIMEKLKKVC